MAYAIMPLPAPRQDLHADLRSRHAATRLIPPKRGQRSDPLNPQRQAKRGNSYPPPRAGRRLFLFVTPRRSAFPSISPWGLPRRPPFILPALTPPPPAGIRPRRALRARQGGPAP